MQKIKTNLNKFVISMVALMATIVLTFCCSCQPANDSNKLVIEDATGQKQTLAQPISKVCSSHNPTMNDIVALGGGGKYVAGFAFKDKAAGLYERVIDNWADIKSVWNGKNIDVDTVKTMNADLCIIPEIQTRVIKDFEEAGVPCFIALPETESMQTVVESMQRIATVLGCQDRGKTLTDKCESIINDANNIAKQDSKTPSVIFLTTSKDKAYTGGSFQSSIIEQAGGANLAKDLDTQKQSASVSEDDLAKMNPDVIYIPNYAEYTVNDLLTSPKLADVTAVKNKAIYVFPCSLEPWDFPDMSCCLGVSWAAHNLHPANYSLDKLKQTCDDFYTLLYGKTFTLDEMGIS